VEESLYTKNRKQRKLEKQNAIKFLLVADKQDDKFPHTKLSALPPDEQAILILEECMETENATP